MRTQLFSRRTATVVVLTSLALTGVAACGGDDDDDDAGGEPLTEEEFTTQANAICKDIADDIDAAGEAAFGNSTEVPDEETIEAFINDELIPAVERQISELGDLTPPEALQEDVDAVLASANSELDDLKDTENYTELLTSGEDPFADTNAMATDLELTECAG